MAEFEGGNLYDMNKVLVAQHEKHLKGKALQNRIDRAVIPYFQEKNKEDYFMLLCHEKRDYTVFHIKDKGKNNIDFLVNTLKECLHNRGAIFGLDRTEDGVALEIWIRYDEDGEMACYYLFPYSQAIVEIGD